MLDSIAAGSKKTNPELIENDHQPYVLNTESVNDYLNKSFSRQIKLNYPETAKRNGVHGLVVISFIVDENGNEQDHKVIKGIGSGCDEEAMRIIKTYPFTWHPALKNGKPVSTTMVLPLRFSIRGLP